MAKRARRAGTRRRNHAGDRARPGAPARRRPPPDPRDALWATLLTELGFPARCPRAACRRNRACRPAHGHFACRQAHPEAMAQLHAALSRGLIRARSDPQR
ncbi:MAG: hypothetical protein U1E62_09735 [Alsobacter sp.]